MHDGILVVNQTNQVFENLLDTSQISGQIFR